MAKQVDLRRRRFGLGFTLIELLIVVAIIAILAAIAVPNFLEAQVRSKISRCRADQRSLATAFEAYNVDNNTYSLRNVVYMRMNGSVVDYDNAAGYAQLSTPIAYITNSMPIDPFIHKGGQSNQAYVEVSKFTYEWAFAQENGEQGAVGSRKTQYLLQGFGPDNDDDLMGFGNWARIVNGVPAIGENNRTVYDPTNGTLSNGDIYRVQGNSKIMKHYGNNGS